LIWADTIVGLEQTNGSKVTVGDPGQKFRQIIPVAGQDKFARVGG